jgi:hypothetical protein
MEESDIKSEIQPVRTGQQAEVVPRQRYANSGRSEGSKRTQFKKGNNANPYGRKGKPPPVLSKERHDELDVMWHVYQNPESEDWTYQQALYRRSLKQDNCGFFTRFVRLEIKAMSRRQRS